MWEFPEIYVVKISLEDVPSIIIQPTAQNVRESTLIFFCGSIYSKRKNPLYRSRKYEFCEIKKPTTDRRKHDEKINEVYQHDQ